MERRDFLVRSAAALGVAAIADTGISQVQKTATDPAGVPGYQYRLPQFQQGSRLLFQGDSITDMAWGRKASDRNNYLGHGYVFLIASRLGVDMPEAQLDFYNRGMSGHTVGDLRNRWQHDAIEMKPDCLSILIGVNDVGRNPDGVDLAKWEADYRFLLEASRKANPELRIVLLDPFVLASGGFSKPEEYQRYRKQIDLLVPIVGQLAEDFDTVHLKTQEIFDTAAAAVSPEHWIWDGLHPLPQGHELIARNWIQEVSNRWC